MSIKQYSIIAVLVCSQFISGCDGDLDTKSDPQDSDAHKRHFIDSSLSDLDAINYSDIDGDGDMDLLAASSEGELFWYQNNGEQGFTEVLVASGLYRSYDIDIVDFDQDGRLDILAVDNEQKILMLSGEWRSDTKFQRTVISEREYACDYFCEMAAADFTNDGILDLVYCGYTDCLLMIFEEFQKTKFTKHHLTTTPYVVNLTAADINGDGWVDISHSAASQPTVVIMINQKAGGAFGRHDVHYFEHAYGAAAISDINQDGAVDVVGTKLIHLGIPSDETLQFEVGSLQFSYLQLESVIPVYFYASSFAVRDIDLDGDNDIVSTSALGGYYYLENGAGNFDDAIANFHFDPNGFRGFIKVLPERDHIAARPIRIVDMDNDGRLDILVNQLVDGKIMWGDLMAFARSPYVIAE